MNDQHASELKGFDSTIPVLIAEGVGEAPYNVILFQRRYFAIHQDDGAFDPAQAEAGAYPHPVHVARSFAEVCALVQGIAPDLLQERDALLQRVDELSRVVQEFYKFVPPGHYYSPLISNDDIAARAARGDVRPPKEVAGVDLQEARQLEHLRAMAREYQTLPPFPVHQSAPARFYYDNGELWYFDAVALRHFMLTTRPKRVMEIGAGFSSALMLDVDEQHEMGIRFCFVDPDLQRFRGLVNANDQARHEVMEQKIQTVDPQKFATLEAGDILYIDSSHVAKMDSDVNWYMFEILPRLQPGVFIHIHDVGFPFDYHLEFFQQGRAWNETYLLRAFLMHNQQYRVEFSTAFASTFHMDLIRSQMPLCETWPGGAFWMRKLG